METPSKVTPKDFFLWLGIVVSLYGSIVAFITLLFEYINRAFPDALAGYADPYAEGVRFGMAALIVLVPLTLGLLWVVRKTIAEDAGKATIWVRRWALVLTLFIAGATIVIDLITLITTFLGGEITTRFLLKVLVILLVAGTVFMHFLAELKGYWLQNLTKARYVGIAVAVLTLLTIGSGFLIVGTPEDMRLQKFDAQRTNDLQSLQWRIIEHFQQKRVLPESIAELADPISGFVVPSDPQTKASYTYEKTDTLSFKLCANFSRPSVDTTGQGSYGRDMAVSYPVDGGLDQNWAHGEGEACFVRTIDPEKYPAYPTTKGL